MWEDDVTFRIPKQYCSTLCYAAITMGLIVRFYPRKLLCACRHNNGVDVHGRRRRPESVHSLSLSFSHAHSKAGRGNGKKGEREKERANLNIY